MGLLSSNDLGGKQHRRDGSTDTQHPSTAARDREVMRWALPVSVALTQGISVDFFYLRLLICLNLAGHLSADEVQGRPTPAARLRQKVLLTGLSASTYSSCIIYPLITLLSCWGVTPPSTPPFSCSSSERIHISIIIMQPLQKQREKSYSHPSAEHTATAWSGSAASGATGRQPVRHASLRRRADRPAGPRHPRPPGLGSLVYLQGTPPLGRRTPHNTANRPRPPPGCSSGGRPLRTTARRRRARGGCQAENGMDAQCQYRHSSGSGDNTG